MSGVYIHIPFCRQSCIYCNFYFKNGRKHVPDYTQALLKEIKLKLNKNEKPVSTLYFGGGTPSFLGVNELKTVVNALSDHIDLSALKEFTLEANPDDMDIESLKAWKDMGVGRLSVGVQSFNDDHLKWMNRAHSAEEAEKAITLAQDMGFDLSLDIIFGIPGSTREQHEENLRKAISFNIQHLSCYGLTLEDKTPWKKLIKTKDYAKPDEDLAADQFRQTMAYLKERGWLQYEISNYCLPGKMAVHNTAYWRNKTYIGLGPSAHSYDGNKRCWNVADLNAYIELINQGILPEECEMLNESDHFNEYVMTSLRTIWGINVNDLRRFSKAEENTLERLEHYVQKGMLSRQGESYILTDRGKFYADAIASDLFIA